MSIFYRPINIFFLSKKVQQGFTQIELMVVVALLAIIFGITAINLSFFNNALMRSELDALHAVCMHLQRCAQASNKPYTLSFDIPNRSYSYNGYTAHLPQGICFGVAPGIKGPPASSLTTINDPITFKNHCITFYPRGIIQAGTVYLADTQKRTLYALSCSVAQVSHIRKYRYEGVWKLLS